MVQNKCAYCGNCFHWLEAFAKFGYDDGDGQVQTQVIAKILEDFGYKVKYSRWRPHNTIIFLIVKDGIEDMPLRNTQFLIGYDDPESCLPKSIQEILNRELPSAILFH